MTTVTLQGDPPPTVDEYLDSLEATPAAEDCIPYAEAERLLAIAREHGDAALTPAQHEAIWDCLLAQPASHAWLQAQVEQLKEEMAQRGLEAD